MTARRNGCPFAAEMEEQNKHNLNFPVHTHNSKDEKSLITYLAMAGYSVHILQHGGYVVAKNTHIAKNLSDLLKFAVCVGVCNG